MKNITIGIPRALFYYRYKYILTTFFKELGINILVSPYTDDEIINNGKKINNKVCPLLQIYFGHIDYLKDKVDYILNTRIKSDYCDYYNCLYDIVNNLFDTKILDFNIEKRLTEESFINMGKELGFSKQAVLSAYKIAIRQEYKQRKIDYLLNQKRLDKDSRKILIVSKDYIYMDNYIRNNILNIKSNDNIDLFYSEIINPDIKPYNKAIIDNINTLKKHTDKTIFISTKPCVLKSIKFDNNICIDLDNKQYNIK